MKNKKHFAFSLGLVAIFALALWTPLTPTALAQYVVPGNEASLAGGAGYFGGSVLTVIEDLTKFLASLLAGLSILMIVIGGIMYIVSAGDKTRTELAKNIVQYAVIGLVVALLAYVIVFSIAVAVRAG